HGGLGRQRPHAPVQLSLFGPDLSAVDEPGEWEWIAPALGDFAASVSGIIPQGFDRYLRIHHGAEESRDGWAMPPEVVESVAAIGARHTTSPDRAWFAVWEGYGWLGAQMMASAPARRRDLLSRFRREKPFDDVFAEFEQRKAELAVEVESLPRLVTPGRNYLVLAGPVGAAATMRDPISLWALRPPDLWWPADRAWFVGSDTDLEWTYVAGESGFADEVLAAWPERVTVVDPRGPVE
ncbi:MAG: hypothetical protein ACLFWR_12065, partial [Acidimicrobiales bacterium]